MTSMSEGTLVMQSGNRKRNTYMDILTIISCFAVICLHSADCVWDFKTEKFWFFAMFVQTVCHWPVPVFLMLSAANLLNYRDKYSTKYYFKKRLLRTFVPFLIWSCIGFVYRVQIDGREVQGIHDVVNGFAAGDIWPVYWYFYALFPLYLTFPIIGILFKKENKKMLWYWFGLCFFFNALFPLLGRYGDIHPSVSLTPAIVGGYLGYVVLGWLLVHTEVPKKVFVLLCVLAAGAAVQMYLGTYYVNLHPVTEGQFDRSYISYVGMETYAMAAAVFLIVKKIPWDKIIKGERVRGMIVQLSRASLGIYLIHMFVLYFLRKVLPYSDHSIHYMVLMPFLIYAISAVVVLTVRKIPVAKYLFP